MSEMQTSHASSKNLKEPAKKTDKQDQTPAIDLIVEKFARTMELIANNELSASGSKQTATRCISEVNEILKTDPKLSEKYRIG